jgi:putative endonuclease
MAFHRGLHLKISPTRGYAHSAVQAKTSSRRSVSPVCHSSPLRRRSPSGNGWHVPTDFINVYGMSQRYSVPSFLALVMKFDNKYCIYLLECRDGTYYCGITTDMNRRLRQHNEGNASSYTRGRIPVKVLVRTGNWFSRSMALKLESIIKKHPRHRKPCVVAVISKTAPLSLKAAIRPKDAVKYTR